MRPRFHRFIKYGFCLCCRTQPGDRASSVGIDVDMAARPPLGWVPTAGSSPAGLTQLQAYLEDSIASAHNEIVQGGIRRVLVLLYECVTVLTVLISSSTHAVVSRTR